MGQRSVVVETGLDEEVEWKGEAYTRHARTRFVEARPIALAPRAPELGDAWEPLTVRARLERMGETMRRLPLPKPADVRSCMPEPKREMWKDMPAEPLRPGVTDADLNAAYQVVDVLTEAERGIAWALANRVSDRELGRWMRCDGKTAAARKQAVLAQLAAHWNTLTWRPDAEDINRARKFVHRNFEK